MKKYLLTLSLLLIVLCSARAIQAQEPDRDPEKISIGIGVNFFPSVLAGDAVSQFQQGGFANFIVPMQLGPHIFIEPEFGVYAYNASQTLSDSVKYHFDRTIVRTGFGVFYSDEPDKNFEWYVGGRLGILSSKQNVTGSKDTSAQWGVFYTGAAFGAEYFFSPHFSIGGEFQLNHFGYGAPIINGVPDTPVDSVHNVWSTNASLSGRFYF
ncbi:MAG TPA: outer membrane beta-barrel protein [Candidatus Kapabacteria bacterium]|nr:outer membrane beta-barrel protein [Candidatus Kapabacteria bacterium]